MADDVSQKDWHEDRSYEPDRDSDSSPILSPRIEKLRRYAPYTCEIKTEVRERRSTFTFLAKTFMACIAMIFLCVVLYIPVYNKANVDLPKGLVAGWSVNTNRDARVYVHPNNLTTMIEPKDVCSEGNKLFLLIVVCSSTVNYKERNAIRETWGSYKNYIQTSRLYYKIKEKYKNYNYTYDLYNYYIYNNTIRRHKRDISSISQLLPELAKALKKNLANVSAGESIDNRFNVDILSKFDANNDIDDITEMPNYDYDYPSNVMRIPPKGYEDTLDVENLMEKLKNSKILQKLGKIDELTVDFKLLFLLGLPPSGENFAETQERIRQEADKYGDVLQEGFFDSYNNLTLKSIMMLKWVTNKCRNNVRYILKSDDDMYINVPKLIESLRNRSKVFDEKVANGYKEKEYLLIGDLIMGAKPVHDSNNKWFSPRYMYSGRVYPRYLSGSGYVMSFSAAEALYRAALKTSLFHLEDIYITGMCAFKAKPRLTPRDDSDFSYMDARTYRGQLACVAHSHITTHRVRIANLLQVSKQLKQQEVVDKCERIRLTQIRRDKLRPKTTPKKTNKTKMLNIRV